MIYFVIHYLNFLLTSHKVEEKAEPIRVCQKKPKVAPIIALWLCPYARRFNCEYARLQLLRADLCTNLHEIQKLSSQDSN